MTPTTIGGGETSEASARASEGAALTTLDTGAIALDADQRARALTDLQRLDFLAMSPPQIVTIGADAEKALNRTLDGFLARLDKNNAEALFKLFDRLQRGVSDADLPAVLKQVQTVERPSIGARFWGLLRGKGLQDLVRDGYDRLRGVVTGKTRTLGDEMGKIEKQVEGECRRLLGELQVLQQLKESYATHRADFALAAGVASAFLKRAKAEVADAEANVPPSVIKQARLQELHAKLQMLESRAVALEGVYTRLPADQMVIQQIEQAGVSTLQETVTTAGARFASIKMTLLALQGALAVKSVQNMSAAQARLDAQLQVVRSQLVHDVAASAAAAPGDNRAQQAQQIAQIVADAKAIDEVVAKARQENAAKFDAARATFKAARDQLSGMSP